MQISVFTKDMSSCKKSQITFFVLLGFIILIIVVFLTNIEQLDSKKGRKIDLPEATAIKLFVENCIRETGREGLIFIGKQSGYYKLQPPSLKDDFFNLSYYFYKNLKSVPSKEKIEDEISSYLSDNLLSCTNNFSEFKNIGFKIVYMNVSTKTAIEEKAISFHVNFPIKIQKGSDITDIYDYYVRLDEIPLKKINEISADIVDLQYQDPSSVCMSCIYDFANKYDVHIDLTEYPNDTLIFKLSSYNTSIVKIYNFTFAMKLPEISCNNLANVEDAMFLEECLECRKELLKNKIKIDAIPNFNIKVGDSLLYDVNASGKNIAFEDFTNLFDIDKTSGKILFTPNAEQVGKHQIWVRAFDLAGNEGLENFEINVV